MVGAYYLKNETLREKLKKKGFVFFYDVAHTSSVQLFINIFALQC